jgi:hypothetical protein
MIYNLTLPKLSDTLTSSLITQATNMFTADNITSFNSRHPWPYTSAQMTASNIVERMGCMIPDPTDLAAAISSSLPFAVDYEFFIMKNTTASTPALMPPSRGLAGSVAINYYLQLGGSTLYNFFFNEAVNQANTVYDPTLTPTSSYTMTAGSWYAFDATMVRSISGITDTCIVVSLAPTDTSITFPDLLQQHPSLFGPSYTPNA